MKKRQCAYCGAVFEVTTTGPKKYCSASCRTKATADKRNADNRAWEPEHREPYIPPLYDAPKDEFVIAGKSLPRLAREAKAFRMSYGEYIMRIRCGTIEDTLKQMGVTDWKSILRGLE